MGEEGNDGSKIKLCSPKYARSGFPESCVFSVFSNCSSTVTVSLGTWYLVVAYRGNGGPGIHRGIYQCVCVYTSHPQDLFNLYEKKIGQLW
jgi:hypothetical protein